MKIKKIEVENFGRLKNTVINLKDGIQIIYGENEAGKSTLMEFIKIMLYGKKANTKLCNSRAPWDGSKMGGAIEFQHKGKIYSLKKDLDKNKNFFRCISDDEIIQLAKNEEIGKKFLGINMEEFERSSYISCFGDEIFALNKNSGKIVKDMVLNLVSTGDENISKKQADERLDNAIKYLKKKDNRSNSGLIDELENKKSELEMALYSINSGRKTQRSQDEISKEISKINKKIQKMSSIKNELKNLNLCARLKNLNELALLLEKRNAYRTKIENSGIKFENSEKIINILSDKESKIQNLSNEVSNLKKTIKNSPQISQEFFKEVKNLFQKKEEIEKKISIINKKISADINSIKEEEDLINKKLEELNNLKLETEKLDKQLRERKNFKKYFLLSAALFTPLFFITLYKIAGLSALFLIATILFFMFLCFTYHSIFKNKKIAIEGEYNKWAQLCQKTQNEIEIKKEALHKSVYKLKTELFELKLFELKIEIFSNNLAFNSYANLAKEINNALLNEKKSLEAQRERLSFNIKNNLNIKNCKSFDELLNKYNKNMAMLDILNTKNISLLNLKKDFALSVCQYNNIDSYESALAYFNSLKNDIEEESKKNHEILYLKKVLDLESEDFNYIKNLISEFKAENFQKFDYNLNFEKRLSLEKELEELEKEDLDSQKDILINEINKILEASRIKADLEKVENELKEKTLCLESLKFAKEKLDESYKELKMKIVPEIKKMSSDIFYKLTLNKYNSISFQDNGSIIIEDIPDKDYKLFSSGTIDQAYLSVRLSLSKIISQNKKVPIFIDDILARYDDNRLKSTINYLKDYSLVNGVQIIIFTCHKYILDLGRALSIPLFSKF